MCSEKQREIETQQETMTLQLRDKDKQIEELQFSLNGNYLYYMHEKIIWYIIIVKVLAKHTHINITMHRYVVIVLTVKYVLIL